MHGAAAAEGDKREVTNVVAALRRDGFDRLFHLDVDDVQDAVGGFEQRQFERLGDFFLQRSLRLCFVEFHSAAEKMVRIENPAYQIGVGDGDLPTTAVITDRTGIGAGAVGTNLERAHRVEARDRAAAGADGVNVEHGQADGALINAALSRDHRVSLMDQRHIAAGAAHVEGYNIFDADSFADADRCNDATGGAGKNRSDGFFGRAFQGRKTPAGLHDVELWRFTPPLFLPSV